MFFVAVWIVVVVVVCISGSGSEWVVRVAGGTSYDEPVQCKTRAARQEQEKSSKIRKSEGL